MQFTVPQFIEHEAKIIGPLTIKQFAFVGTGALICFILYFTMGESNFLLFLALSITVGLVAFGLAFVKVNTKSLPMILVDIFAFSIGPKIYLWKRKEGQIKMIRNVLKKEVKADEDSGPILKLAEKSKLKSLAVEIELRKQ